jgi:hypothetical protein
VRKLIATTALALVIGGPAVAQQQDQQTQQPGQDQATAQQQQQAGQDQMAGQDQQMMAGQNFYQPQANDLFVSDLMDADVYAPSRDAQQDATATQDQQQQDQAVAGQEADDGAEVTVEVEDAEGDTAQETVTTEGETDADAQVATDTDTDEQMQQDQAADQQQMQQDQAMTGQQMGQAGTGMGLQTRSIQQDELEGMDNIGSVSDVIVDEQGEIRAIVLDVGGFLGIGAREVALSTEEIEFGYDQENPDQFYVISQVTAEELENAPEFDRDQLRQQREEGAGVAQDEQQDAAVVGTDQQQQPATRTRPRRIRVLSRTSSGGVTARQWPRRRCSARASRRPRPRRSPPTTCSAPTSTTSMTRTSARSATS